MSGYRRLLKYAVIIIALALLAGSCKGTDFTSLSFDLSTGVNGHEANAAMHHCLGLYDIIVSADRTKWDVYPRRAGMAHLNIIPLLEGDTDFLTIPDDGIVFEPDYIAATVSITHPLESAPGLDANFFTGFDVKGIVMFPGTYTFPDSNVITQDASKGEGRVLNADGYSRWWNPTEFADGDFLRAYVEGKLAIPTDGSSLITATLNPYKNFIPPTQVARRSFPSTKTVQVTYNILLPETGLPFALMYAIDAAYEPPSNVPLGGPVNLSDFEMTSNQPEPYQFGYTISNNTMWGDGVFEGGGYFDMEVDVFDWQDPRPEDWFANKSRGIHAVCVEAPGLFEGRRFLTEYTGNPYIPPVAHAATVSTVEAGQITSGQLEINGVVVPYTFTPVTNTSKDNADAIVKAINLLAAETHVNAKFAGVDGEPNLGRISFKHQWPGAFSIAMLDDLPNIQPFHFESLSYMDGDVPIAVDHLKVGKNLYYIAGNGNYEFKYTISALPNFLTIKPGSYPLLISAMDHSTDPIFPGDENRPTAYQIIYVAVSNFKPNICDETPAVHNVELGTGTIVNANLEYRADCDFIAYPGSPYLNRLIFNKGTTMPDGIQEICVMFVDTPDVATALPIITITDEKKGFPLILQEDSVTGNIIVVNHMDQDNILVFDYLGNFLNSFDYGDGDLGFNSPIAVDFDDQGTMWAISHRGKAGPELRHWYHSGNGIYVNAEIDRIDLAPTFGTGFTIYDLKLLPSENFLIIFASDQQGHIEFYDTTTSPPTRIEDRTIVNLYNTPLAPLGYPSFRIAVGGDLMIDLAGTSDQARCRIVAAANFNTGPLVFAKFDFFANKLNQASFTQPGLCFAMNPNSKSYLHRIVALPVAQSNHYRVFDVPASGW